MGSVPPDDEERIARRALELCSLEQQRRNDTYRRFPPVDRCPRHGCLACRQSAAIEDAIARTAADIAACFEPRCRTAPPDGRDRRGDAP